CTNVAVVLDWSKYCHRLVSVDAEARTCVVEPGIALDELNRRLEPYGLKFGPKPATHTHCTLGGMIGNKSCGASAQRYGKTVDNVRRLEVLTYGGCRLWAGPVDDSRYARILAEGGEVARLHRGARELAERYADDIRAGFPEIPRRVSGYNLDSLLPEKGFDLARALVGSESTLVTVLRAELDLVPIEAADALVVLGYPDICAAADDVPRLLEHCRPLQLEALDDRMAQLMREERVHTESLSLLPAGGSWLFVQLGGDSKEDADAQADALLAGLGLSADDPRVAISDDTDREQRFLQAREAGLGVTARPPDGRETWEGWEDSAVAPERLGDYLRDLKALFAEF
ncbi:FAD-binding oxidoreductase, partial [Streptomyces sp. NPDC059853]|uniref:FAD-binding oxidoreductase n=1 Tax=Streptomyces sp. NPDC059853 TaxID=3346973 RepID=UPI00365A502A